MLHSIVQLPINLVLQNPLILLITFWPKFYWSLFRPSLDRHRRSIWQIITEPVPDFGTKTKNIQNRIVCLKERYYCHSYYQIKGAYAHLNESSAKDLDEAVHAAKAIIYYDDPLRMAIPYEFLLKRLPKPPDGITKGLLSLSLIISIYSWIVAKGLTRLWYQLVTAHLFKKDTHNIFVRFGRKRRHKSRQLPTLHIKMFTTHANPDENAFSWDTDGIPFVIDNSATGIICNVRKLFVGPLQPTRVTLETAEGLTTKTKYVGTMRLVLTDDARKHHTYNVPDCVYDPDSPINILGVPFVGKFFGDQSSDMYELDGTTVCSGSTKSHFIWDHGKHERHFMHGLSELPELYLYVGTGYFNAFTTRIRKVFNDKVHYAFSSAFSLEPQLQTGDPTNLEAMLGPEGEQDKNENPIYQWYCPETCDSITPSQESDNTDTNPKLNSKQFDFKLGMDLVYRDGKGNNATVVYEGASSDTLTHTVRLENGTRIDVHDSNLQLLDQPDFSNIPTTPLDYRNEVGHGLSLEEAQALARPRTLSPLQQELMSWHHRLYHLPFRTIFRLADLGILPKRFLECRNKQPLCIACQFGQAHRRPWRTKGKKSGSIRKKEQVAPGDGVSIDQIISAQPGLIPQMAGFLTSQRLWGCTTFVDHVSDYVYVHLMRDITLDETLLAKSAWEKVMAQAGHMVKHYHADNGRFADNGFIDSINDSDQKITFCGVGAHHQNGIVENKNKILTQGARTLLLHGMRMWPQMVDEMFWPFAMKAVAERLNTLQIDTLGRTPESILHGIDVEDIPVKSFHTLFCPVYVLDARLQNAGGAGPPKWEPRSRIGVYLGHSPFHAGSVALVWNPTTGRVSPQFHVVFDDDFSTVPYMEAGTIPPNWKELVQYSSERATAEDVALADTWLNSSSQNVDGKDRMNDPFAIVTDHHNRRKTETTVTTPPKPNQTTASEGDSSSPSQTEHSSEPAANSFATSGRKPSSAQHGSDRTGAITDTFGDSNPAIDTRSHDYQKESLMMPHKQNPYENGLRRSQRLQEKRQAETTRKRKAHVTFGTAATTKVAFGLFSLFAMTSNLTMPKHRVNKDTTFTQHCMNRFHEVNELYDGTMNEVHQLMYSTDISSNECFTFTQAMKQDDKLSFVEAMEKEINDHESRSHWAVVHRDTLPTKARPIKAIWSFKRKRAPDGSLLKHKARMCAHGGMQQWGDSYWETYSPVVNMLTVRLILAIAKIHKLDSKAIDFVLAFPQADLEEDIWMDLPAGFQVDGQTEGDSDRHYLLKLKANLYGLKQASYNWYEKLKQAFIDRDFKPSDIDPCLYIGNNMIVLTYVDDCIIIGPAIKEIDAFVTSMKEGNENFVLTDEGDIDKFLGIEITQLDKNRFKISQPYLIDRIVSLLNLNQDDLGYQTNPKATPVGKPVLNKDLAGKPRKEDWNYRTAVGMLTYLQGNSRPEISMSVHQTARFCNDPKLSHEKAIKRLGRYLMHTRKEGIVYNPDISKGLECYVDADFAGGYSPETADDAANLLSRTGMVIMYANCPIYWRSSLQTEIALSTAEAEYIALSSALRVVLPLMTMMEEIDSVFPLHIDKPSFVCKVHEDNQSCIKMATGNKFSPRTKHIALKYHHFKSHVKSGRVDINYCPTDLQLADILTKPLPNESFYTLRYMLCGWGHKSQQRTY